MSLLKDIHWMASPLAIDQRNALNDKGIHLIKPLARFIDPKNEIHVFRKIQHWTLEIDGKCYELSPDTKKKLNLFKKTTDMIKPHCIDATHWREIRESKMIEPEKRKIGQTRKTHDEILADVNDIWADCFRDWYGFFTQNCQNFVHTLFNRVRVESTDAGKGVWDSIPDPVGYQLANGAQLVLAGKMGYGTTTAYLGAVANVAPAAQAGQALEATGMMGVTSGGGTSSITAAGGGTPAGSTTAGGGTVTSSHVGFGAKAAGIIHGGHAAAIGATMVKAGAVAVLAHPVTGLAVTGGLAYLAIQGKRGKGWNNKNLKTEEMDVFHLLEVEEEAFEEAENPDRDVVEVQLVAEQNAPDRLEISEEELAEGPMLGLIVTEPLTGPEKHEAVPVEEEALEEAENPDRDVVEVQLVAEQNDPDQLKFSEEELAEGPILGLIVTEPLAGPEKHEAVPALQDTGPAQTTL